MAPRGCSNYRYLGGPCSPSLTLSSQQGTYVRMMVLVLSLTRWPCGVCVQEATAADPKMVGVE